MTEAITSKAAVNTTASRVRLPSGIALTCTDANQVTRARETSLVVVTGSPESGKTTLLASLLHCFQRGPFADHLFAGSNTLVGFDQRCHLGRTRSRLPAPDTPRTIPGDERRILHLQVANSTSQRKDVLLTDVSGEDYDEIRHSVDKCRQFELFARADYLVFLVDGERLADSGERHTAKIEAMQMLQCMFDAGHLNAHTWLDMLIAKCDLMNSSKEAAVFADNLLSTVASKYAERVATVRCGRIAARPDTETEAYPLGFGVSTMFPAWLNRRVRSFDLAAKLVAEPVTAEFDRFLARSAPHLVVEQR